MEMDLSKEATKEEMKNVVLRKADNVILNLKKAWEARPADLSDEDEKHLLQAMEAAKRLRDEISAKFDGEGKIG